ncbi:MAG: hypothetical protein ACXVWU_13945 [Nocardioides sp.]
MPADPSDGATPEQLVELAHAMFDLAREGDAARLSGAVFKGEDAVVRALLAAGADPDAGTPTARETAAMFGRGDLIG